MIDQNALELALSLLQGLMSLVSLLLAAAALRLTLRARRVLSTAEQLGNIDTLFDKAYQYREFPQPLLIGEAKVVNLKEARVYVRKSLIPVDDESEQQARDRFLQRTLDLRNWENVFAYEVSLGLESVGASVLAGAIPLTFVLASSALLIVDDWLLCEKLVVKKIRRQAQTVVPLDTSLRGETSMHRIHGEWLAYASALWLSKAWSGGILDRFMALAGGRAALVERERQLRRQSLGLLTHETEETIERVLQR